MNFTQKNKLHFVWYLLGLVSFFWGASNLVCARERQERSNANHSSAERPNAERPVIYKQHNTADFDALLLEGNIKNPNEFYFVHRSEEKFGSLVQKRKNFHKELLRDAVMMQ